tara:strand:+ start:720 stop:1430 length:711 start_codon:yes stop_codon:yes gene_type:complete
MKTRRRRRKRTKNYYFTKVHEDAIALYIASDCEAEKTKLYVEFIQPAFSEMVDKITYTYKFTSLPNVDSLRDDCKIWLTTILDKYDPNKGSKAFSYFSVITKNWFIHKVKKTTQQRRREIQLEDVAKEIEKRYISNKNEYESNREEREFWGYLLQQIDNWTKLEENNNEHSNEVRVLKAVNELLKEPKEVEILNKKAIYLYLREITGLNTKQIAACLKKFRIKYRSFKKDWDRGDI